MSASGFKNLIPSSSASSPHWEGYWGRGESMSRWKCFMLRAPPPPLVMRFYYFNGDFPSLEVPARVTKGASNWQVNGDDSVEAFRLSSGTQTELNSSICMQIFGFSWIYLTLCWVVGSRSAGNCFILGSLADVHSKVITKYSTLFKLWWLPLEWFYLRCGE